MVVPTWGSLDGRRPSGLYVSSYYVGGAMGGLVPALAWRIGGWTACVAFVALVQAATILLARRAWRTAAA